MKIFTGNDRAQEMGYQTYRELQVYLLKSHYGIALPMKYNEDKPIHMHIDFGRMLAKCECGAAEYVQPDDPYFFCKICHNATAGGLLRPVIFPDNLKEICEELLNREVQITSNAMPTQAIQEHGAGAALCWRGETLKELEAERLTYTKES